MSVEACVASPRREALRARSVASMLPHLPLVLIVGIAFVVTALWVRSIHTFTIMPDELGYVKQSIEIAGSALPLGPHDFYFNSWSELLPAISAPLFGGLGMVDAFYTAHTLYALLLASTAVPTYLLARELRLGRLAGNLVAALSVTVPWLVLSGAIMTEDVGYPVFTWTALAVVRALHAPSAKRDLTAVAAVALAFFARTQFAVLGPVLVVAVVTHHLALALADRGQRRVLEAVSLGLHDAFRRHRALWFASAAVTVVLTVEVLAGSATSVFGNYISPVHGNLLPSGFLGAGIEQLDGVILGIGVVPLTLTVVWMLATLIRPRDPARLGFAVLLTLTLPVMVVILGSFQQRFLSGTTDRYLFYIVPLLFVGTAAWVVDRRGSWLGIALAGAVVGWIVLTSSLHYMDSFSITDPSFNFHRVLIGFGARVGRVLGIEGLDPRVPIAIAASGFVALVAALRRTLSTPRMLLVVTMPLLAFGAADTGYAMTKLRQQNAVIPASHPRGLTWIDRSVPGGARVGLMLAPNGATFDSYYTWWQPSFWNKTVQREFVLPGADALAQGSVAVIRQDLVHGRLVGLDGVGYLVKLVSDSRFGVRGALVKPAAPGIASTFAVYKLTAGLLQYGTSGVDQSMMLEPSVRPSVRIFGTAGSKPLAERVTLTLQTVAPAAGCPCHLSLGRGYGSATLPAATPGGQPLTHVSRTIIVPPGGNVQLNLDVTGRSGRPAPGSVKLASVQVSAASPRP